MRKKNLIGQKFNRLTVMSETQSKISASSKKIIQWLCKCDCGKLKIVSTTDLQSGHVQSCGCLRREKSKNVRLKAKKYLKNNFVENTSLSQLQAKFKNNTSGVKGVFYDEINKCWVAVITFQKHVYKKSFKGLKEDENVKNKAIRYRKFLEEKYFKPILDKYNNKD